MLKAFAIVLACGAALGAAHAGARQDAKVLMAPDAGLQQAQQQWGFADAIVTGDTVYISGVVAVLLPGERDLHPAYERAFVQIGGILSRSGAGWDDVVDILSFHTDLTTQMPIMVDVKQKYVRAPYPAWTAIGVSRLIPDNGLTEIKIVAKLPAPRKH